ncbi:hypothetical protein ACFOWM_13700 [Ferruginibacter yonginensis]|uniref:Protein-tyrosine-phosphatase n=1 Tax=Ferruginibacter yonginensis TaxID=1310416 RepID=A0ABV8QVN3_9BACT
MKERPHLLVVCGRNKRRSRTAEHLFKNDDRFSIRSAGLSSKSAKKITAADIIWADVIVVMEPAQKIHLQQMFTQLDVPLITVLHIPDTYEFMDDELIELLTDGINEVWHHL